MRPSGRIGEPHRLIQDLVGPFEALAVEDVAGYGCTTPEGEDVPLLTGEVWDEEPDAGAAL